jgi:hypothetical protein
MRVFRRGLHRSMHVRDWTPAAVGVSSPENSKSGQYQVDKLDGTGLEKGPMMSNQHGPEGEHRGRSRVALQAMRSHVQPGSFPLLLVASLLLYVLHGLAVDLPAHAILGRVAVACAGLYVLSASRTTLWLGVLVAALSITFEARLWTLDPWVGRVLQDAIAIGFLLWVLVVVLREVAR